MSGKLTEVITTDCTKLTLFRSSKMMFTLLLTCHLTILNHVLFHLLFTNEPNLYSASWPSSKPFHVSICCTWLSVRGFHSGLKINFPTSNFRLEFLPISISTPKPNLRLRKIKKKLKSLNLSNLKKNLNLKGMINVEPVIETSQRAPNK